MTSPASAKVLVAGDGMNDVGLVVMQLRKHFKHVATSTTGEAAETALEHYAPDVVVLAFKEISQAQPYCQALRGRGRPIHSYRSVLLCKKEDAPTAFELCKKQYFHDFVVYWPGPADDMRIPMSVWLASRAVLALREQGSTDAELATHARHLRDLERTLTHEMEAGAKRATVAHHSMVELEQKLAQASDEFATQLTRGDADAVVKVRDADALTRNLAQFKAQQLGLAEVAHEHGVKPMNAWAQYLKEKVEPSLAATQVLAAKARQAREAGHAPPMLLVVDDDPTTRALLAPALRTLGYDVLVVHEANQVLRELERMQPDVILIDLASSSADVVTLTRRLKASPETTRIPIVVMSADTRRETLISTMQAGASDFIAKPFTREVLRAKLERVLRGMAQANN